ncbi:MAG TPA: LysR family transcriptional regulator [Rickettsiales bacterium]|nr:LysR family transcriptional regulator [Rickettsiales bacterium]
MVKDKDFYYKKSRLNQLRGFCNVVQCGCSGVKAAARAHIEPTAISKQISALERDLGIKLFERARGHRLSLTKEGKMFYELAVKQMQGIDSLFNNFNTQIKEKNRNTLNLGLYYTAASYIFPKLIGKMLKVPKFKNLNVNILNISKDEAIQKLINKEIDLAFYPINVNDIIPTEIEIQKNIIYSHAIICSKDHPLAKIKNITKEDIEKYDFLIRDIKSSFSIFEYINLKKANMDFKNATPEITIELVKYTKTITGIPEIIFDEENAKLNPNIVCKNINHLLPESYFYIMKLKNSLMKDSVKWLLKELRELKNAYSCT